MSISLRFGAAALLVLSSGLQAQELRFGVQGLYSVPSADLRDLTSSSGFGLALTLDWHLQGGHLLRPRLEYIGYQEKEKDYSDFYGGYGTVERLRYSVNEAGLGLDYVYYPANRPEGFWCSAGVQEMRYEIKLTDSAVVTYPGGSSSYSDDYHDKTKSRLGYAVGLGYDFSRSWGMGLRLTSVDIEDATLNAFTASVAFRF